MVPCLVWLSGLSSSLQTKGSPVQLPVRAHAWVTGQVSNKEHMRGNRTLMFLSLSFSLPTLSKIIKQNLFKNLTNGEIKLV